MRESSSARAVSGLDPLGPMLGDLRLVTFMTDFLRRALKRSLSRSFTFPLARMSPWLILALGRNADRSPFVVSAVTC